MLYRKRRSGTEYEKERDAKVDSNTEWSTTNLYGAVSGLKSLGMFFFWFALWVLATLVYITLLVVPDDVDGPNATEDPNDDPNAKQPLNEWLREYDPKWIWDYVGWIYPIVIGAHWLITMRDGYVAGLHTVTGSVVKCWTQVLRSCCGGFNSCFARGITSGESFLYTTPATGWGQFIINVLFWAFVLGMKLTFDYFLVVRNIAEPIVALLRVGYLSTGQGDIGTSNIPNPDADWILIVAICIPALLILIVDTGVFYQVGVFIYGCGNGLLRLSLGLITDWRDVIKEYSQGVSHFHQKMLSNDGKYVWTSRKAIDSYYEDHLEGLRDASPAGASMSIGLAPGEREGKPVEVSSVKDLAEWTTFSNAWDHIIGDMRENDLISNAEEDDLVFKKLPVLDKYGIRPLVLPCIFYAGKVQAIMDRAAVPARGNVTVLQEMYSLLLVMMKELSIIPGEASMATLASITLFGSTTSTYHVGIRQSLIDAIRAIITNLSAFVAEGAGHRKKPAYLEATESDLIRVKARESRDRKMKGIAEDAKKITDFAEIELEMLKAGTSMGDAVVKANAVKSIRKHLIRIDPGKSLTVIPSRAMQAALAQLYEGNLPQIASIIEILRKAMTQTEQQAQPDNLEARRLLRFFMASLFNPQLKTPAPLEYMMSLTTLVPHYAEDVIYALDPQCVEAAVGVRPKSKEMTDLVTPTGYEISTIEYLRVLSKIEWDNFIERILARHKQVPGAKQFTADEVKDITEVDFQAGGRLHAYAFDLMMWASQRGQLLARTTRGMLLYEKALRVLAMLENPERYKMDPVHPEARMAVEERLQKLLEAKFRHIVTSQVYGEKKASSKAGDRWLAYSVDQLMKIYPSFRVAYIDSQMASSGEKEQWSVLLRNVHEESLDPVTKEPVSTDTIKEIYRVKLPIQNETKRGVVLGEGKPENQNHAAIFCFGEAIQTVDMNQDNCLAEALKMRNLLKEFGTDGRQDVMAYDKNVVRNIISYRNKVNQEMSRRNVALVGFREYIFSNTAGSVGAFAAGAEFAFGTIVQRTMANPGGVRFHYGHPDVWNKLFTMTRGGVSKATRAFHISEDVFGGYNTVQRGARIKYREYISVGKGRDVGFEQINGFEAKVAGGNGEQAISRDVYRLGTRFDWFRLMSWYHSGIGFFMNTALLMSSIYVAIWVLLLFALVTRGRLTVPKFNEEGVAIVDEEVDSLIPVINSVQILQIGFLSILPYFGELCLEEGLVQGFFSIARQFIAGSLLFFIFRQQTSAHYFVQDVYYGGAAYVATGRGFALTHTPFVTMFSNFGRSHMYFGFQLGLLAFVLAFLQIPQYGLSTWGTWLVSISLFFGPFWFNPLSFVTTQVYSDYLGWRAWMLDNRDPGTKKAWYTWHTAQLAKARNTAGLQTDHGWNRFSGIMMQAFNAVLVVACFENLAAEYIVDDTVRRSRTLKILGIILFECMVLLLPFWSAIKGLFRGRVPKTIDRALSIIVFAFFVTMLVLYIVIFGNDNFDGLKDIVLLTFANFTIFVILAQVLLFLLPGYKWAQDFVDNGYYAADTVIGLVLFAILFLLSLIPLVDSLQGTLLFNFEFVKESQQSGLKNLIKRIRNTEAQAEEQPGLHVTRSGQFGSKKAS